jgi:predicted O-methyltransferase YrrM
MRPFCLSHLDSMNYINALDHVHEILRPGSYVEIGCREGISLSRARCPAIGIDPEFEIRQPLTAPTRIFKEASDHFFARRNLRDLLGGAFDLAFIDGMHRAENVLRDFINLERQADRSSVILIDDILPEQIEWTARERATQAWTGDVYKIVPFLRQTRPDLRIDVFDIEMKGLAIVHNLDPGNTTLAADLDQHAAAVAGSAHALETVAGIRQTMSPRPAGTLPAFLTDLALWRRDTRIGQIEENPYLDLLKRSLLNEIYLDDELRILYLRDCVSGRETFDYEVLHDIRDRWSANYDALAASRQIGQFLERNIRRSGFSHTMIGRKRLDNLHACLDIIRRGGVPGDIIETGVWRGGACILAAGYLRAHGMTGRRVLVADSFEGLPKPSVEQDLGLVLDKQKFPELAVSEQTVRDNFAAYGLLGDHILFLKGWFKDTLKTAPTDQIALLRMDGDLYESTMDALVALYDKVVPGGVVIADDYGVLPVCRKAIEDFFAARNEPLPQIRPIDWSGVYWLKPDTAKPKA